MEDEGSPSTVTSKTSGGVIRWMESIISAVSQTFMGLPFLKLFDYCLYVAEKSAQWSLPSHEISAEESGKMFGKIELVRPLPWIFFLPGLIILRIIRGGLNMGAFLIGYPHVEAIAMVKFLQKSRRRLRAFYLKATKSSRRKDKILMKSIRLSLSTLFCLDSSKLSPSPPPIKMFLSDLAFDMPASPGEKSSTESAASPTICDAKRKFSEVSSSDSESETVLTQLDNCASENSSDDSDFNPAKCNEESSTSSSGNEDEQNISLTELEDIRRDSGKFLNNVFIPAGSTQSSSFDEKEKSTSAIELEDTQNDAQGPVKSESQEIDNSGTSNAFPLDKTTSDKETDGATAMNETHVDTPDTEATPPPPPPPQDVTDGEANHNRNEEPNQRPNQRPYQRPKHRPHLMPQAQNSSTFDNAPPNQEKKNRKRQRNFARYTLFQPHYDVRKQRE